MKKFSGKCLFLAHAGIPYWDHVYPKSITMGYHPIGVKCQCGKSKWTKEMQERNDEAWDKMTSDSNLNRM